MYIVTGAAGFIGSNVVQALNRRGLREVLAVDDLTDGQKFRNLRDAALADYLDKDEFRTLLRADGEIPGLRGVIHLGACADTTVHDGKKMLDMNYAYSKELLEWTVRREIPLVYASSAAVYGASRDSAEVPENEKPLNVYGYSKLLFDRYVRRRYSGPGSPIVGLRFFNVYGPGEAHKGKMASMAYQLYRQMRETGVGRLFRGTNGIADGEQQRDFVSVEDIAELCLFFLTGPARRAVVNAGTGAARSFNDLARAVSAALGRGKIEYVPFPDSLRGKYQDFTQADLERLRAAGYAAKFLSFEDGVARAVAAWQREDGIG